MIVDGRAIATEIYDDLRQQIESMDVKPHLTVFTCAPNFETGKYLNLKKRKAEEIGIGLNIIEFPESITTEEVIQSVLHSAMQTDGIVLQLPFPVHINIDEVFKNIPTSLDVDVVHYDGTQKTILPPVVGAIEEIAKRHDVLFASVKTAIVGEGRLVGYPSKIWTEKQGAQVTVINKKTENVRAILADSQIVISGAGQPGLITPDMITDGVVIFDAGTSEEGGVLKGDAAPECAEKASLFTPVPGGIGPVTVAILLKNLVSLIKNRS